MQPELGLACQGLGSDPPARGSEVFFTYETSLNALSVSVALGDTYGHQATEPGPNAAPNTLEIARAVDIPGETYPSIDSEALQARCATLASSFSCSTRFRTSLGLVSCGASIR